MDDKIILELTKEELQEIVLWGNVAEGEGAIDNDRPESMELYRKLKEIAG